MKEATHSFNFITGENQIVPSRVNLVSAIKPPLPHHIGKHVKMMFFPSSVGTDLNRRGSHYCLSLGVNESRLD